MTAASRPEDPSIRKDPLTALTEILIPDSTFDETMHGLVEMARDVVTTADVAGMTLLNDDGVASTPFFTDELSPHVDQIQYESDRGPCLDAWKHDRVVVLDTVDDAVRPYPEFERVARRFGIESVLALPLRVRSQLIGALNLYAFDARAFTARDVDDAQVVANVIGTTVRNASAYWETFELNRQLSEAMASRAVIEQAKGIIMSTMGTDAESAFELLRGQSQAENRKLRDIARELVERQTRRPERR